MRIAVVTREFPPFTSYTGGIGRHFSALVVELVRQGHAVEVLTVTRTGARIAEHGGARVHLLQRLNPDRLWFVEEVGWTLTVERNLSRLGRFDIVLAPEWGGEASRYSARRRSGPLVTQLTTSLVQVLEIAPMWRRTRRMRLRHRLQAPLERRQTERSDGIMASSHAILDWTRRLWDIDGIPTAVVPNMVEPDSIGAAATGEPPPGFPAEGPVVAFAGRLEIRKGVHILAEAMRLVWDEVPEAHIVLVGRDGDWQGGRMSAHLRAVAGARSDRLHILGNQPPARLYPALRAADVIAFPSLWENFSLGSMEAMALGRPIVVTSGSGFDDFFTDEHDSLMVPPGEHEPLARAIVRLLEDPPLRSRLSDSVLQTIQRYRPEPVTRQHLEFFEQVAGRP